MAFRILVVCTANICRSPLAERLLRQRLQNHPEIEIDSAGTSGLAGHEMDAASARALRELGGDPSGHVARVLTTAQVAAADLVLTAATSHRAAILQAEPIAFRKTFTVREFARLGAGLGPLDPADGSGLPGRVRQVAAQRGLGNGELEPGSDEIADPYGAPWREVEASAAQISVAVDGVIASLGLSVATVG